MSITASDLECMILDEAAEPKALPLSLLAEITNDFSDDLLIGKGGFAVVYKGILENGDVAVKRMLYTHKYENEFHREVECLMKTKHRNIVRFLGYCADSQGHAENYYGKFVIADLQERLLCFEYLPKGSLGDYITDASRGLEWRIRYRIIKDICEGLLYLHQKNIVHLDLKPGNILLDRNMVAKITDFGLSRIFEKDQSKVIATKMAGTMGYLAPEFTSHVLTHKFDLYSLGIIIMEILTGYKGYQDIDNVLKGWSNRLGISEGNPVWEQIKVCAEIAMECTEFNPTKRPDSMNHIIERLVETESAEVIPGARPMKMLDVHPLELCFPFESNKLIPCSLNLSNNIDEHVAFRLIMDDNEQHYDDCFVRLPVYGIVPPRSTYTLVVTAESHHGHLINTNDLILESATLGDDEHIHMFQSQPDEYFAEEDNDDMGINLQVQVARLKAVFVTSSQPNSPEIKMLSTHRPSRSMYSLDTNHDEQWIITGEELGHVRIWNYQTQKIVDSLKISDAKVTCVKFITRKQWFVAGTDNDLIHVYQYCETKMRKITSFRSSESVHSLVVHPTQPYLLSSHYREMKLWDWDKAWECVQTFDKEHSDTILQVVFNAKDTIASASEDNRVKVWSLNSPISRYTFSEHSDIVNCLDFFTCYGQEYLVTASDDKTVKIWDMQKMICVRTLEVLSPVISVVYPPRCQILITGSKDGCIYLWSITSRINLRSHRPWRIVNIVCVDGVVHGLSYLRGSVVIGKENSVVIMNIDNNVNNLEQTMDDSSEPLSSAYNYMRVPAGGTTSEVTSGGGSSSNNNNDNNNNLLDVALDLIRFPCEPESISWSLHITNKAFENVAFRLTDKRSSSIEALKKLPLYGIVPSRSRYTLVVSTPKEELARVMNTNFEPILQSSISGNHYVVLFMNQDECRDFFEEAKEMGKVVHEVAVLLKGDYHVPQSREANSEPALIGMQITSMKNTSEELCSLDAHPIEPWIITGHANGQVRTWNYGTQGPMHTFQVSERPVSSIKVVARAKWIVAATSDGFIHVYNCARMTQIRKIRSIRENDHCSLKSIAIHPTEQYLLSTSMKLWKWNKGWDCIHNFLVAAHQVAFNPDDANCFASVSGQCVIEVWSLASRRSNYTMSGHLGDVNCLEFFRRGDGQYLITGSDDCTAKIWDLQKRACVHTMEAIMSPVISAISLPGRPYLVTGSKHGTVQLWSSTDFRLKRTINFCGGGPVRGLVCLAGSRRVIIGQKDAISIMEIDDQEAVAIGQNDVVSITEIDEEDEV